MFVGWRLAVTSDDIPRLIEIGSGQLDVDLLSSANQLDGVEVAPFGIVEEVGAWLRERCDADGIDIAELQEVSIRLRFSASETARSRRFPVRELDFELSSTVRTDERTYAGSLTKGERWVGSRSGTPWVVTDR